MSFRFFPFAYYISFFKASYPFIMLVYGITWAPWADRPCCSCIGPGFIPAATARAKAGPEGVKKNKYITDFKYKLVNKKKLNKAAKGIIVKPLWEANTDVEDYLQGLNITDPDKKKFIASRLLGFDELERKLNELIPLLQQAKHKTMDYYRSKPDSFAVVYGTDLANDYLNDLIELFKD